MNKSDNILSFPIDSLPLSNEFKTMAQQQHFRTLEDILNWPVAVLLMHEGFTYHIYEELLKYCKNNNLPGFMKKVTISPKY
jgi:hypothetical protein